MNVEEINVPAGIRYISEWQGFNLPNYPHIMDKQIPGCGFTEYCLRNNMNVILVCPRKILLENKTDQHNKNGKLNIFYAKSDLCQDLWVDKNLMKFTLKRSEDSIPSNHEEERKQLKKEIERYHFSKKFPSKILVTYDSFRKVKEILLELGIFNNFYIVVDEFQSIFVDSRFKASTEMEFVSALQGVQRVCYVSATPMMKSYLDKLEYFKDLPYYKLNWNSLDPTRVVKPKLTIRSLKSINTVAEKIIDSYKQGKFETSAVRMPDKSVKMIESKEAVIYVNSVSNIVGIVKKCNLKPEEVNILCADTDENRKRLKARLGKNYTIGKVPLRDEPRKMFTFCTRTVYLGADFYSDNARTFILSDANVEAMAVDISLDLPQILGRQRLSENPWKNKANLYVKVLGQDKKSIEDFKKLIDAKLKKTNDLLLAYQDARPEVKHSLAEQYLDVATDYNYKSNYVSVNKHLGSDLIPQFNNLALVAEQRAFDIQQIDYADRFVVFNKVYSIFNLNENINKEVSDFQIEWEKYSQFQDRLRLLCTSNLSEGAMKCVLEIVPENIKSYYLLIGPEKLKSLGYNYSRIKAAINVNQFNKSTLANEIYSSFIVGTKISKSDIKNNLEKIYNKLGYEKTPKATDLEEWFEIKRATIIEKQNDDSYKKINAFEIIKKK